MSPAFRLIIASSGGIGLLLTAGWAYSEVQSGQRDGRYSATNGTYTDPEGRNFKVAGICSVDIRTVSCWDVNGNLEPKLTRRIIKRVKAENGGFLELRFQGKSFFVVIDGPPGPFPEYSWSLSVVEGQHGIGPNYTYGTGQESEKIQRVYASNEPTTVNIKCNETVSFPSKPILLLKHGSTISIDGVTLTFDKVIPHVDQFTIPKGGTYRQPESWDYLVEMSGSESQPNSLLFATGISKKWRPSFLLRC